MEYFFDCGGGMNKYYTCGSGERFKAEVAKTGFSLSFYVQTQFIRARSNFEILLEETLGIKMKNDRREQRPNRLKMKKAAS